MSTREGNPDVFVMSADGSGQTNLTRNPAADARPSWAHDGQIAFMSMRDGNMEIYVMAADGTNATRLTTNATSDDYPFIK